MAFGPYFNGEKEVFGDPISIHRKLYAHLNGRPNDYFALIRDYENQPQQSELAATSVEIAVRKSFDMVPFDKDTGTGADQELCFKVLNQYLEYEDQKKVNGRSRPISPPSTDSGSTQERTPDSDSGLIVGESAGNGLGISTKDASWPEREHHFRASVEM